MRIVLSVLGVILLFSLTNVIAQDSQEENEIYVLYRLNVENDNIMAFEEAWEQHNQEFHQDSPVYAFYFESGPYSGMYSGVEGPMTWTEHENLEYTDAHGNDWLSNVHPYLVDPIDVEWWRHLTKYTQNPSDEPTETSIVTAYYINNGEVNRFMRMLDDWMEANTEQGHDGRYNVYQRQLHGQAVIAIVSSPEDGLAALDESNDYRQRFIDTHGVGRYHLFLDDYELSVEKSMVSLRNRLMDISTQN